MARPRARPRSRRRPGRWIGAGESTQTISTGTPVLKGIIQESAGQNAEFLQDHGELYVRRIQGYLAWYPNLNAFSMVTGTVQAAAMYAGIVTTSRLAFEAGVVSVGDVYLQPDHPWLWTGRQKFLLMSPANMTATLGPGAISRCPMGWQLNWRGNRKIETDLPLALVMNYTDDGQLDAGSFWWNFRIYCEW